MGRRIFYVDVGNMPSHKAKEYVADVKKQIQEADASAKESALYDYFFASRDGVTGTRVEFAPDEDFDVREAALRQAVTFLSSGDADYGSLKNAAEAATEVAKIFETYLKG